MDVTVLATQLSASVPGGTGRYTTELLTALGRSVPSGTRLRVVRLPGPGSVAAALDRVPVPISTLPVPFPILARLWARGLPPSPARSGVVHSPTLLCPPVRWGTRLVVTVHDVVPWTHPETLTARGVAFHRTMGARAARSAAVIVTPTEAVAEAVRNLLRPAGPVVPVLSGARVTPVPADAATRLTHLGVRGPFLLFVGTAEPRKGLDVLVAALSRPELAEATLVVAGQPGWGDVSVEALAGTEGVDPARVVVTGMVSDSDLASLYAGARVVVLPSRAEGFGLPVAEAMAHGVPVVISDDPALREVAGGAALSAPVGDVAALATALGRTLTDARLRESLVARGRARALELTWERTAERMWRVYADAAGGAVR